MFTLQHAEWRSPKNNKEGGQHHTPRLSLSWLGLSRDLWSFVCAHARVCVKGSEGGMWKLSTYKRI